MLSRSFLGQWRHFSTTRFTGRPALSGEYKSKELWDKRLECSVLKDEQAIKLINSKIISGSPLDNLELDFFVNISSPNAEDISSLQVAISAIRHSRKSIHANKQLPSTQHALTRLLIQSQKLPSLLNIMEQRVEYGLFPDPFALNLIYDTALEQEKHAIAARIAVWLMLQEEFGINKICDNFSLYSIAKYIESQPDFDDWNELPLSADPLHIAGKSEDEIKKLKSEEDEVMKNRSRESESGEEQANDQEQDDVNDDEDDDDAEYIRIPFLRNPYFDNHFDLTNPRALCGKTMIMLGRHLASSSDIRVGNQYSLLGEVLSGDWKAAANTIKSLLHSRTPSGQLKELSIYYINNLHNIEAPSEEINKLLTVEFEKLTNGGLSMSESADNMSAQLSDAQATDIDQFKVDLNQWSRVRAERKQALVQKEERARLIEEVRKKKEELNKREQYLYFYDNLKKSKLTRIEYD